MSAEETPSRRTACGKDFEWFRRRILVQSKVALRRNERTARKLLVHWARYSQRMAAIGLEPLTASELDQFRREAANAGSRNQLRKAEAAWAQYGRACYRFAEPALSKAEIDDRLASVATGLAELVRHGGNSEAVRAAFDCWDGKPF